MLIDARGLCHRKKPRVGRPQTMDRTCVDIDFLKDLDDVLDFPLRSPCLKRRRVVDTYTDQRRRAARALTDVTRIVKDFMRALYAQDRDVNGSDKVLEYMVDLYECAKECIGALADSGSPLDRFGALAAYVGEVMRDESSSCTKLRMPSVYERVRDVELIRARYITYDH